MRPNGADAILRSLEAEGVDVVFDPGGAILPTYDAFARGTTVHRARPARAGRRAHGGGVREGDGSASASPSPLPGRARPTS